MAATSKSRQRLKPTSVTASRLIGDIIDLIRTLTSLFTSYRPELHYMRGPGPKWHAKNDPAPHATTPSPVQGPQWRPGAHRQACSAALKWTAGFHEPFTGVALRIRLSNR